MSGLFPLSTLPLQGSEGEQEQRTCKQANAPAGTWLGSIASTLRPAAFEGEQSHFRNLLSVDSPATLAAALLPPTFFF